ncbi:DnaJ family domain-containing protein [Nocardia paucivorans]|uniref:DnaJ family domain-containing protein n=1 Tax=Nocardia paucivorans TaxID=114259 RepID=UPI0002D3ED7E|nr:DUF1992 domain-containing protein [Nocardia paucivorans]
MTERKPPDIGFESWVDRKIREATERGEFENLRGAGKPLPGAGNPYYDEDWWLKEYLRREGVDGEALLPASLLLRRDVERLPETVAELRSEQQVREEVSALNHRIVEWLRMPTGPHIPLSPVDADEIVRQWRRRRGREPRLAPPPPTRPPTPTGEPPMRYSWWRRLLRRGG